MLKDLYNDKLFFELRDTLNVGSMAVPRLVKVCINMGIGEAAIDPKLITTPFDDLALIAGQRPVITRARKSVAGFKIRQSAPVGLKVTLRGARMYEFLERCLFIALPRERDFLGFRRGQFDGHGNFSFGIKEHISFIEVNFDKGTKVFGMDVTIVTSAEDDDSAFELLKSFGFPFIN